MKKLLIPLALILLLTIYCVNSNITKKSSGTIKQSDITGYWIQTEQNSSGKITDLTDDKSRYLEVTDTEIFFHIYYRDTESFGVSERYYELNNNKIYHYHENFQYDDWKDKLDKFPGDIIFVSFSDNKLILTEYNNDKNKDNGYEIDTYQKIDVKDWPIKD